MFFSFTHLKDGRGIYPPPLAWLDWQNKTAAGSMPAAVKLPCY
jgi:hypothetical protein